MDHRNIQDLGRRPFTTMLQPAHHQRAKTEGTRRPSLQLRSRSKSSAPNYSRPQDRDDRSLPATSFDRRTPQSLVDRRSVSGGSIHTRGDSLDNFTPKAWMAKGSRFLKRQNSKHELTSLRTLDWVEDSEKARLRYGQDQPPSPYLRHSRVWSTDDPNAGPRLNISEPFNFHHVTHTQPHHVQRLENADPSDLISEFSALRASQASQPKLRGIKAEDIQREDLPQDALLPDSPSQPRNGTAGWYPLRTSTTRDHAQHSVYGATSPVKSPYFTDNFSQPSTAYHRSEDPPISPSTSRWKTRRASPPGYTRFHYVPPPEDTFEDTFYEPLIPTESPESLDYPIGTWNDGVYDLASPHAVTTDDGADRNRQVPFSMVKTELAPVEEGDESDEKRSSIVACTRKVKWGPRNAKSVPITKESVHKASNACIPVAEDSQSERAHPTPPVEGSGREWLTRSAKAGSARASYASIATAEDSQSGRAHLMPQAEASTREWSTRPLPVEEDVFDSLHGHCMPPATISEPSIEDTLDDIPVRPRLSRHLSVGPNDMERFWDMASDAINCSYALGAEGDSHFDWHRSSIHEHDPSAPATDDIQASAADTASESPKRSSHPASPFPSMNVVRRSSSVYSSSPPSLLPLKTVPSKLEPPSASTESSFSSIPEAATPNESIEPAMPTNFCTMNCKEWCRPAYIVSHDVESQMVQDDLYHQMYTSGYSQDAPFQLHNTGRVDGSPMSNSPRSSRSPISKSSSQESFLYAQAAFNTRRPHHAGSIGSLPELMPSKNSRERFDPVVDQLTDKLNFLNPSDSPSDSQQTSAAQRHRSPNLAKDAAQNIILSKAKTAEESVPLLPAPRDTATSDSPCPAQDSSNPPPLFQPTTGRRMRSGSATSSLSINTRGSRGSHNIFQHTPPARSP